MPAQTSMLHVRIDDVTKEQATEALEAMGLTMAEAIRIFLHRIVATQAFPLELKVPNPDTLSAMNEARTLLATRRSRFNSADDLFDDLKENQRK